MRSRTSAVTRRVFRVLVTQWDAERERQALARGATAGNGTPAGAVSPRPPRPTDPARPAEPQKPPESAAAKASAPPPLGDVELTSYVTGLALSPRAWVHRRVEQFTFVDARTVRRRMSIDFELHESSEVQDEQLVWVPILTVADDLRAFDLHDAEGMSIPLMTATHAAKILAEGLSKMLISALPPDVEPERILDADDKIRAIVTGTGKEAVVLSQAELASGDEERGRGALLELIDKTDRAGGLTDSQRRNLRRLLQELAKGRMLLAQVPHKAGERQLIKVAYNAQLGTRRAADGAIGGFGFQANQLASMFGCAGRREVFSRLIIGQAESYHAEVVAPPDTFASEVLWRPTSLTAQGRRPPPAGATGVPAQPDMSRDTHFQRPHVRARARATRDRGDLTIVLHARREALVLPLLLSALVIALTLGIIPGRLVAKHHVDAQTVAALLLVPFALSAYYIRSAEHDYVTRMLRGVRLVAVIPVIGALVVIAMLGLGLIEPATKHVKVNGTALRVACESARTSMVAVALLAFAASVPGVATGLRGVRRAAATHLGRVLLAATALLLLLATTALLLATGLSVLAAAGLGLAGVVAAWMIVLLGRVAVRELTHLLRRGRRGSRTGPDEQDATHRHGGISRLPPAVRTITLVVALAAVVVAVLAGGWIAHTALSGDACETTAGAAAVVRPDGRPVPMVPGVR